MVEYLPSKQTVASSSLVFRSIKKSPQRALFYCFEFGLWRDETELSTVQNGVLCRSLYLLKCNSKIIYQFHEKRDICLGWFAFNGVTSSEKLFSLSSPTASHLFLLANRHSESCLPLHKKESQYITNFVKFCKNILIYKQIKIFRVFNK